MNMAVPCSKNHPPPEIFFRRGEQSGWTPDPDEFEIPDLSVLEGVVCCQFQKLSAGASSGFDAIPIPLIKHACLPVRCDDKFKQVMVNSSR